MCSIRFMSPLQGLQRNRIFSGRFLRFYVPSFEKVGEHICFCLYVRPSVRTFVRGFVQAMVFLLNVWIPLLKKPIPFSELSPLMGLSPFCRHF